MEVTTLASDVDVASPLSQASHPPMEPSPLANSHTPAGPADDVSHQNADRPGSPSGAVNGTTIYSAIYSGVPVYEMMCRDTPVMRRMSDSYMNATQILKVAGFTKPKRTKILEREVLNGEHEKIQGGYGKYQGTWIPLWESRRLASRYNVENDLRPILDFDPQTGAVAPKPPNLKVHNAELLLTEGRDVLSPTPPPVSPSRPERLDELSVPGSPSTDSTTAQMEAFSLPEPSKEGEISEDMVRMEGSENDTQVPESAASDFLKRAGDDDSMSARQGRDRNLTLSTPSLLSVATANDEGTNSLPSLTPPHSRTTSHSNPFPGSVEAEYYQRLQQGLLYDETTAQNYVQHIQDILRNQDAKAQQSYQYLSSQGGAQPQSGDGSEAVIPGGYNGMQGMTAYHSLAMLNMLSLAAQQAYTSYVHPSVAYAGHANTASSPSVGSPMQSTQMDRFAKDATPLTTENINELWGGVPGGFIKESIEWRRQGQEKAESSQEKSHKSDLFSHSHTDAAGSGDQETPNSPPSDHHNILSPPLSPGRLAVLSSFRMRQREALTNLHLYSDAQISKILDPLKDPETEEFEWDMVLDNKRGSTMLHLAAAMGRVVIVRALVEGGADVAARGKKGETALMRAVQNINSYNMQNFEELADLLRDSIHLTDAGKRSILHHCARSARHRHLFAAAPYYFHTMSIVLEQCYHDTPQHIREIINAQDAFGNTALHYASRYGCVTMVRILLRFGANVHLRNWRGDRAGEFARYDDRILPLLADAARHSDEYGSRSQMDDASSDVDHERRRRQMSATTITRSPSPDQNVLQAHSQTLQRLSSYYGSKLPRILRTLVPPSKPYEQPDQVECTQRELEEARRQLASAKQELVLLKERRRRVDELWKIKEELEQRIAETTKHQAAEAITRAPDHRHRPDTLPDSNEGQKRKRDDRDAAAASADAPPAKIPRHGIPASDSNAASSIIPTSMHNPTTPAQTPRRHSSQFSADPYTPPPAPSLHTQVATLQTLLRQSERNRHEMLSEIETIKCAREEKDRKFKKIIAACCKISVDRVEGILGQLVKEFE
ncbi:hypothetical protein HDU85_000235 [Gaertneriomyces sp. JEL0708]|nr:hypothetical protein HDU85_000235 [Gaertneriomyces sp. JEL0708]